jgi:deazaflavin-dependent oxidoreductase (nitroreductase family)
VINASLARTSDIGDRAAALLRIRWLVRAPIWLYRARLGFVFGSRLLMLEHRGRKTGARRYAVLEIVVHPVPGSYVVVSGFGDRSQWYRNICADSRVRFQVGSRKPVAAIARRLNPEEAAATLAGYAARHPRAWAQLRRVLENTLGTAINENGTSLPMVALDARVGDSPGHEPSR